MSGWDTAAWVCVALAICGFAASPWLVFGLGVCGVGCGVAARLAGTYGAAMWVAGGLAMLALVTGL